MKLALPLGLLGLISIAALILIYILKPKYQDKKFSSTYIWKLSLKYAKRKVPLQWLQSSLLFIVQLLLLVLIAFTMANPYIVLDTKSGEKIVILDASASMLADMDGKTRFERAKSEISSLVDVTTDSHKISIILAGEESSFIIRRTDSASYAKQKLFEAECSFAQPDLSEAMELAEGVLAENPNAEVYLYTDCDYEDSGKVTVVNVAKSEWNVAVLDFSAKREKGSYVFTAKVASYGKAAEIAVSLNIDGKQQLPKLAVCEKDATTEVVWDNLEIGEYDRADVHLSANDSFVYDNDFYIYAPNAERFKVQLVSDDPGFLYSALSAVEKCQVVVPNENQPEKTEGFDLYIYENYAPSVMPKDGTVWLINPPADLDSSWGITVNGTNRGEFTLSASGSNSETARTILNSFTPLPIKVTEYTRVMTYVGYESIMQSSSNNDPVFLVKNENGQKTAVLAFDIHMSDLTLRPDFPLFIDNLCNYSMAYTVGQTLYEVGDSVKINAKTDTETMTLKAEYGDGTESESAPSEFPVDFTAERSGVYTVTQYTSSGRTVTDSFFVRIAESESVFGATESSLVNPITPFGSGTDSSLKNDTKDIYTYLIAIILLLLCVEWGMQYREQY